MLEYAHGGRSASQEGAGRAGLAIDATCTWPRSQPQPPDGPIGSLTRGVEQDVDNGQPRLSLVHCSNLHCPLPFYNIDIVIADLKYIQHVASSYERSVSRQTQPAVRALQEDTIVYLQCVIH